MDQVTTVKQCMESLSKVFPYVNPYSLYKSHKYTPKPIHHINFIIT